MKAVSQNTRTLVRAAIIAALYTVLPLLLQPLSYGGARAGRGLPALEQSGRLHDL